MYFRKTVVDKQSLTQTMSVHYLKIVQSSMLLCKHMCLFFKKTQNYMYMTFNYEINYHFHYINTLSMLRNMPFYIRTLMNHKNITVVMVWVIFEDIFLEIFRMKQPYSKIRCMKLMQNLFVKENSNHTDRQPTGPDFCGEKSHNPRAIRRKLRYQLLLFLLYLLIDSFLMTVDQVKVYIFKA